jgi:hypothetical protein
MHDALFEHQQALEDTQLVQYASDIGLDTGRVSQASASTSIYAASRRIWRAVSTAACMAPPTLFVNGVRYEGLPSTAESYRVLLSELGDVFEDDVDQTALESFPAGDAPRWIREEI